MTMQDQDFWRRMGGAVPGMFDLGVGLYGRNAAEKEAAGRLGKAQGPLYNQAMTAAGQSLAQASNMDPRAAAAERFNSQRGLLAGSDAKSEADMMRMLHSKGLLGVANYNPGVEGIAPSGVAMNPHMAAFYAGRGARDARMAHDSMEFGEGQIDRMVNRAGMLQGTAANAQNAGLRAQGTQPSRAASNMNLLKGATGVLKDTGLLQTGVDWLKGLGGFGSTPFAPMEFDFSGIGDFDFGSLGMDWSW